MANKLKNISTYQWVIGVTIAIIMSLSGLLLADMKNDLNQKVDNKVLEQMIKVIEVEQRNQKESAVEQKQLIKQNQASQITMTEQMIKAFNALNEQMIIMNEQLKKE